MPLTNQHMAVAFGAGYNGLATVGYALKSITGTIVVARTTTNVTEYGSSGDYFVSGGVPSIPDSVKTIEWDTGGATPITAHEALDPYHLRDAILADTAAIDARLPTDPADESLQQAAHTQTQTDIGLLNDLAQSDILSDATPFAGANIDAAISSRSDFDETTDPVELLDAGGAAGTSAAELVTDIESDLASGHGSGQWDGTDSDWTSGEREQIRDALGVTGAKTAATGGQIQTIGTETAAVDGRLPTDPADESLQQAAHTQTQVDIAALNDPDVAAIADGVWDEAQADHLAGGSTGESLDNAGGSGSVTPSAIADAVWDEALAGHVAGGSAGAAQTQASEEAAKIDSASTVAPGSAVTGSLLDRVCNKGVSKTYDQSTDSLEATRDRVG